MNDFTKILDKQKNLRSKMKESQEKIKKITVRVCLDQILSKLF